MKITQLKSLVPQLQSALRQGGRNIVISQSYKIEVNPNNFFTIPTIDNENKPTNKIVFIDGGNAQILGGVNYSLQMLRVAACIYENNKQIENLKNECFGLTTTVPNNNELFFHTKLTPQLTPMPTYSIYDKSLAPQGKLPSVSLIPEVARRFCEIQLATQMMDQLQQGDAVILDGLITPHYTGEIELVEQLLHKAKEKQVIVIGLAKTSRLMTESGSSAMDALKQHSPGGCWRYSATTKKETMTTHFVRLHDQSKHVFRIEVPSFCLNDIDNILAQLKQNSTDPIFLGYPYGLIATDRFARVSNREQQYLKMALQSVAGQDYKELAQSLQAINAHEILDNV